MINEKCSFLARLTIPHCDNDLKFILCERHNRKLRLSDQRQLAEPFVVANSGQQHRRGKRLDRFQIHGNPLRIISGWIFVRTFYNFSQTNNGFQNDKRALGLRSSFRADCCVPGNCARQTSQYVRRLRSQSRNTFLVPVSPSSNCSLPFFSFEILNHFLFAF